MATTVLFLNDGTKIDIEAISRSVVETMIERGDIPTGGGSGEISPEEIASAVASYIEANPEIVTNSVFDRTFHWCLSNPATLEAGCLSDSTGEEITKNGYSRTGFELVNPGETLKFGYCQLWWYDENQNFISKAATASSSGYQAVVPDGVSYVRAAGQTPTSGHFRVYRNGFGKHGLNYSSEYGYENRFPMLKGDDSMTGFKNYLKINRYADKQFLWCGDSFSVGAGGVAKEDVIANLGAKGYTNKAISGGSWSTYSGYVKNCYEQLQEAVSDGVTADVIVILLGANDMNNNVPLGSYSSGNFDLATLWGGMQQAFEYAQTNYHDAQIFVGFTPSSGLGAGSGEFQSDASAYISAIESCCLRYGIKFIDSRRCGICPATYPECYEYGTGGGHPTEAGGHRIGRALTAELLSHGGWVDVIS